MKRRKSYSVKVGKVVVGGGAPISVQSMCNISIKNEKACFEQVLRLAGAGCDIVRLAIMNFSEALTLEKLKNLLCRANCDVPLVADVHFYPEAAMKAVEFVEKVRINPGNFVDKSLKFSDEDFFRRFEKHFYPLVDKCKQYKKALRLGVNLGSLSKRMLEKHGHTTKAMVESALEYAKACVERGFDQFIFSMKASNTKKMVKAYQELVKELDARGWSFPMHLGVTETGFGIEGRVKSALGISELLFWGIGDTVRVSLTEDPVHEVWAAKTLLQCIHDNAMDKPLVILPKRAKDPKIFVIGSDGGVSEEINIIFKKPYKNVEDFSQKGKKFFSQFFEQKGAIPIIEIEKTTPNNDLAIWIKTSTSKSLWKKILDKKPKAIFFEVLEKNRFSQVAAFLEFLDVHSLKIPVILCKKYLENIVEEVAIKASVELGYFLMQGLVDGVLIDFGKNIGPQIELQKALLKTTGFMKIGVEFISCPGCGRTAFDLIGVARSVKEGIKHLRGPFKVAVMGCVVNGPGEMGDADFGVVGSKKNRVDLYYQGSCVEKDILENEALEKLLLLIKKKNDVKI